MKELRDIIKAYDEAVLLGKRTLLATVVQVIGSSYRRPGARMLVTEDGVITGAISGGCLEGDALRRAKHAMNLQQNKLVVYDTLHETEHNIGIQLGCNGIVYILFEPINPEAAENPIQLIKKVANSREEAVLVTRFSKDKNALQTGTNLAVLATERQSFTHIDNVTELDETFLNKKSVVNSNGNQSILFQLIEPSIQLLIAGAGNDVQPLTEMTDLLGWKTIVADGRPAYATQQRFPKAGLVCLTKPSGILSATELDEYSAVVIMTHNFNYDLQVLEQLLESDCRWIGILGPARKLQRMLDALSDKGLEINEDLLNKLHGPVGLDIGAETPEEIALSIVAEIKAVFSKRSGTSLKNRSSSIHERTMPKQLLQHD